MITDSPFIVSDSFHRICSAKKPIENLIVYWIRNKSFELAFGPDMNLEDCSRGNDDYKSMLLGGANAIFCHEDKTKDIISLDIEKIRKSYKKVDSWFPPVKFADTDNFRFPLEEIEEHREKNGAKWKEDAGEFIIPPSFVGNLCASFLGENKAIIRICQKLLWDKSFGAREYFLIQISYLDDYAGFEKYAVRKDKLLKYVQS
jgi:hypothetical protein